MRNFLGAVHIKKIFMKRKIKLLTIFIPLFCATLFSTTSCCRILSVRTSYFTEENLASYYVGTPDPDLRKPMIGQRLILTWSLPKKFRLCETYLNIRVRYKNHVEESTRIQINQKKGYYIFCISDEKYKESGGLQTYQATIEADGTIIDSWIHPLWIDLITFK